jgi:hypothetical protein
MNDLIQSRWLSIVLLTCSNIFLAERGELEVGQTASTVDV